MTKTDKTAKKQDEATQSSFDDIEDRLSKLGEKLGKTKDQTEEKDSAAQSMVQSHSAMGKALRITSELVGPVLVSGFIGYWLDKYLDTKPLWLIIFFVLGVAAGFLNVFRAAHKMQQETIDSGAYKNAKDIKNDDDDD